MLGLLPELIFGGLYFPMDWQTFVNQQVYPKLVAILAAGRAHGFTDPYILPENPDRSLPETSSGPTGGSYSAEAVAGADGAASDGVPVEKVFDDLVATTRDRTHTCAFPLQVLS